jgi:dihydroflavonol-4-reductase
MRALIHESQSGIRDLPIEKIHGDVMDENALDLLMAGADVVIHLAAIVSIQAHDPAMIRINAEGTSRALDAAMRNNVRRFIHFSSIHAMNPRPFDEELNETRPPATDSTYDYDRSKILSETYVQKAFDKGLETIIFSPTAVMGPFDHRPSALGNALIRFYQGRNPALIPGGYDWVDVRDVGRAVLASLERGTPGEKYILSGTWISIRELAERIEALGGSSPPGLTTPLWLAQIGAPVLNLHARITGQEPIYTRLSLSTIRNSHKNISSKKAEQALGYGKRPFMETLQDTLHWFQSIKKIT